MGPGFEDRFTPSGEGGRGSGGFSASGMRDAAATLRSTTHAGSRSVGERVRALRVAAGLTQTELAVARESTQRRLLRPSTPWATARDGIVAALIGGGSVVVVVGDDESALERIRETENIEGEVG